MNLTRGVTSQALHTMMVEDGGDILVWGNNGEGKECILGLGLGYDESCSSPTRGFKVTDRKGNHPVIVSFAFGYIHTLCLTINGEVYSWGSNDSGQLGLEDQEYLQVPILVKFKGDPR